VGSGTAGAYRVTWGDHARIFSAAELAAGINLAVAFPDNPFCKPFREVEARIREQQAFETILVKTSLHSLADLAWNIREEAPPLDALAARLVDTDVQVFDRVAASVKPVRHTLRIEPV
jgi:hypothetical protein